MIKGRTRISRRMAAKSKNFFPGRWRNSPHSSPPSPLFPAVVWTSCRTSGRRVQMSDPLGRKSRPTSASSTLDFPLLWLPTTATWGRSMVEPLPSCAKMSCSLFTMGITACPTAAAAAGGPCATAGDAASSAIESGLGFGGEGGGDGGDGDGGEDGGFKILIFDCFLISVNIWFSWFGG